MYGEIPSRGDINKCIVTKECVKNNEEPLLVTTSERKKKKKNRLAAPCHRVLNKTAALGHPWPVGRSAIRGTAALGHPWPSKTVIQKK